MKAFSPIKLDSQLFQLGISFYSSQTITLIYFVSLLQFECTDESRPRMKLKFGDLAISHSLSIFTSCLKGNPTK